MRTGVAVLVFSLVAVSIHAGDPVGPPEPRKAYALEVRQLRSPGWGWGEASIIAASAADLITTEVAFATTPGYEGNPLMRKRWIRLVAKPAMTALTLWTYRELKKREQYGWARFILVWAVAVWAGAAAWNISQM